MKFIGKLKEKIIHWCGGFTLEEKLREPIQHEIIKVEAPVRKINFERKYFIDTPRNYIDQEMAKEIGNFILKNGLYEVHTTNSQESPNLLYSIYTVYIVKKERGVVL